MHILFALTALAKPADPALVGTYATADGSLQIVVDRQNQPPRMKTVGSKDVVQLTLLERTSRSGGWDVYTPDGDWVFFLDKNGSISKNDTVLERTSDAKALKKITKAGVYVKPPSAYEVAFAELEALSVRKRFDSYKPQDSGNPEILGKAFAEATEDMRVHYVWSHEGGARYKPVSGTVDLTDHGSGGYYPTEREFDATSGAAAHGVVVEGQAWIGGQIRILGTTPSDYAQTLATGTDGLIWSVDGATVIFVTQDGGRYRSDISGSALEKGGGHPFAAGWKGDSKPLQHTRLDGDDLKLLQKAGLVEDAVMGKLDAEYDGFRTCAKGVFEKGEKELTKLDKENIAYGAKEARKKELLQTLSDKALSTCDKHVKGYETVLLEQIEARNAARTALFESASK